ncbi:MAG TPA: phosphate acyltransferase, partial [Casimicrobiaceae bacterium]|nr:phosphate acyltransferase [Casimicrobiaceae bacterium]
MNVLQTARERIRGRGARVVFPEGGDERIVAAAARLSEEGLATPIVLGTSAADDIDRYADLYRRGRPEASVAVAHRLAAKPLFHAGLMVKAGDADAMIAGVANPTARVIEAGMMTIGLAAGIQTPSSFFLMALPDRLLIYADCAVNADPSAEVLADIAI